MTSYKIAVLPGDGIGPEIVEQGIKVLKSLEPHLNVSFNLEYAAIGGAALETDAVPLPEKTLKLALVGCSILGCCGGL